MKEKNTKQVTNIIDKDKIFGLNKLILNKINNKSYKKYRDNHNIKLILINKNKVTLYHNLKIICLIKRN